MGPNPATLVTPGAHVTGRELWPNGSASAYDWRRAVGTFQRVAPRKAGLDEVIWARPTPRKKPCGTPCVAHCIAGQPRDFTDVRGIWKGIRHRLRGLSPDPVIFAAIAASAMREARAGGATGEGEAAERVRTDTRAVGDEAFRPALEYIQVDRALLYREECETGACLAEGAGLSCGGARELGLTAHFNERTNEFHSFPDVQLRRFQTCMHLVREYERDHGITFDFVSRQRPDGYWAKAPWPRARDLRPAVPTLYLSQWAACYGGADWFYLAPRRVADIVARFADEMSCERLKHPKIMPYCSGCLGNECWLAAWMVANGVALERTWLDVIPAKFANPVLVANDSRSLKVHGGGAGGAKRDAARAAAGRVFGRGRAALEK